MDVLAHVEAAEAKQRRPAPGRLVADLVAAAEVGLPGSADGAEKGRRSWAAAVRALAGRVRRRRDDAVAASMLWTAWVLGYLYSTEELLQPPGAPVVVLMSALCHGVFALAILSWIGLIYHGPGSFPGEEQASQLPPAIAAALSAGHFSRDRPFGPEDSWCAACEHWKPPLAHHCSICGRCGLWMDHHCNFAMQCVGFRNLRCFLVMLFYTQLLCFLLAPLTVRRLLVEPALDVGAGARLAAFSAGWLALVRFVRYFTRTIVAKTSAGWPSHVLLVKYQAIFEYAVEMEKKQLDRQQAGAPAPQHQELRRLLGRLRRRGGGLRGFLRAGDLLGSLALVFGEPPSWRWLLPLLPGVGALQVQELRSHQEVAPASTGARSSLHSSLVTSSSPGRQAAEVDDSARPEHATGAITLKQQVAHNASKVIILPEEHATPNATAISLRRDHDDSTLAGGQPAAWTVSYWESTMSNCRYIFGFPKFAWALLCDVLSLTLVLLCIPLLLTCSRRRPPGAPLFDCSFGQAEQGAPKQPPWMRS
mmetsp:Transcript_4119/g.12046  ORF Transcript_4119/g.12046 Transcript_4119/m.12046 type:complete len:533 (+) Transcript_4119:71-1669(+)